MTRAQSQPSIPFALTAFTDTTVPGGDVGQRHRRLDTRLLRFRFVGRPVRHEITGHALFGAGRHDSVATPPPKLSTFSSPSREGLDASSIRVAAVVFATSVTS